MKVLILNGPNINFIGIREKDLYGSTSYNELLNDIEKCFWLHLSYYSQKHVGLKFLIYTRL